MKVNGKVLTKFILYFSMIHIGISYIGFFSLPGWLLYLTDAALIALVFFIIIKVKRGVTYRNKYVKMILAFTCVIMLYDILSAVINMVNPFLILQGMRSALRFYILFIGVVFYWEKKDVYQFFDWMVKLYPVNFFVIVIQKILWGDNPDSVIGITGTYLSVYITFVLAYIIISYVKKQEKFWKVAVVTLLNFVIAIWGDQRGYFFMFAAIIVSLVILERMSLKKIMAILVCIGAVILGLYIMSIQAPKAFETMTSAEAILEYGTSTSGGYNISRFGAFKEINILFFHGDVFHNLFGYGLGYCETNSPFYNNYGELHYTWFTHQWTFLELGYIGLFFLATFFVVIFYVAGKKLKHISSTYDQICVETAATICIVAVVTIMYFSMHRSNSGYFLYGIVATIPVMLLCERNQGEK